MGDGKTWGYTGLVLVVLAALGLEDLELPQRAQLPPQPDAPLPAAAAEARLRVVAIVRLA